MGCFEQPSGSSNFTPSSMILDLCFLTVLCFQHNADPNARDTTEQCPLHWAAVRGSLPAAETLLRAGARTESRDKRGYTVCHVAAQYGQTAVLYHLALKWNVDLCEKDSDDRTPLHWAAYKGYTDTVRLLLVLNANISATDKEGCTPLHWAAIRGNSEAATVLIQGGSTCILSVREENGCTPAQLAFDKGHRALGMLLLQSARNLKDNSNSCWSNPMMSKLAELQLAPFIWVIIISLISVFVYKVALDPSVGRLSGATAFWCWFSVLISSIGLIYLYKTTSSDPGMIPVGGTTNTRRGGKDKEDIYQNLDSPVLWSGNWNQLCVTCKIIKPLRSKHCAVTNRCIEVFDHYCPWVGNAIGKGNRHYFMIFLWLEMIAMIISGIIAIGRIHLHVNTKDSHSDDHIGWLIGFLVVDVMLGISVAALACTQASQAVRNLTTNELTNWYRYKYLHGRDGQFYNPFDKGAMNNCRELCIPDLASRAPVALDMERETDSLLSTTRL
eukprot:g9011.t1